MSKPVLATTGAVLLFCIVVNGSAQDRSTRDELEQYKGSLAETIADSMTNARVFETNGFRVESSEVEELGADFKPNAIPVRVPGSQHRLATVPVEDAHATSHGQRPPLLDACPKHTVSSHRQRFKTRALGSLDALSYAAVDKDGKVLVHVTDYEADGQPDIRVNFAESYIEIWHLDRWYRVEDRTGRQGVVLNGDFVELKRENNRLIVQ